MSVCVGVGVSVCGSETDRVQVHQCAQTLFTQAHICAYTPRPACALFWVVLPCFIRKPRPPDTDQTQTETIIDTLVYIYRMPSLRPMPGQPLVLALQQLSQHWSKRRHLVASASVETIMHMGDDVYMQK